MKKQLLLIMLFLCVSCVAACGQGNDASQPVATTTPTSRIPIVRPTQLPTHTPAPQSTPSYLRATHGPTVLGVSVSNFFGKYGSTGITDGHSYTWTVYKDGNPTEVIGAAIHADGTVYRVGVVNSTYTNWSLSQSTQACSAFLPNGSSFEEQVSDQIALYSSPAGEIHMETQNIQGDCFLQFANTIGTAG